MENFVCRICGHDDYVFDVFSEGKWYHCKGCSTPFITPEKFSLPTINFKKEHPEAITPTRNNETDTGYDLYSVEEGIIEPGQTKMFETGIIMDFPENIGCQIRPRSGMAKKYNISVRNTPGTVDQEYRNSIKVLLHNARENFYEVKKGDRIAQLVFEKVFPIKIKEVDEIYLETNRGRKGLGDSGK